MRKSTFSVWFSQIHKERLSETKISYPNKFIEAVFARMDIKPVRLSQDDQDKERCESPRLKEIRSYQGLGKLHRGFGDQTRLFGNFNLTTPPDRTGHYCRTYHRGAQNQPFLGILLWNAKRR